MFFRKKNKTGQPEKPAETVRPSAPVQDISIEISEKDGPVASYMTMILERTGRERTLVLLKVSLAINAVLIAAICAVFYFGIMHTKNIYFATTPDGRIQKLIPLTEPYISTAGISNWTTQVITETFSLDFRNWKRTLAKVQPYYSEEAWSQLDNEIRPLIETIIKERLILYAVADEAPRLLAQGLYTKDLYAWRLEFPMTLTHQLAQGTQTFKWTVQVLVGRANLAEKNDGVEILQFIITPR